jgi:hypothetical protein
MSERKSWPFIGAEPAQLIVFFGCGVDDLAGPLGHYPDRKLETALAFTRRAKPSDPNAKFLRQLTPQRVGLGFARLDMTAGKVPHARIPIASCAAAREKQPLTLNQDPGYNSIHADRFTIPSPAGDDLLELQVRGTLFARSNAR